MQYEGIRLLLLRLLLLLHSAERVVLALAGASIPSGRFRFQRCKRCSQRATIHQHLVGFIFTLLKEDVVECAVGRRLGGKTGERIRLGFATAGLNNPLAGFCSRRLCLGNHDQSNPKQIELFNLATPTRIESKNGCVNTNSLWTMHEIENSQKRDRKHSSPSD